MKSKKFFILALSLFAFSVKSQIAVEEWVSSYYMPGSAFDVAYDIAVDNNGNVYVTGYSNGGASLDDFVTIKYNSSGVQQWVRRYNSPGNGTDQANSLAVDNSGNVYVTGFGGVNQDYTTIKYNSSGDSLWVKKYNGTGNFQDIAIALVIDGAGNVYITGTSFGTGGVGYEYATVKYSTSGVQQWVQRYDGPGSPANGEDAARSIEVDASGNVYVTGNSIGTSMDYATIKYNSSGIQQWVRRYNGPSDGDDVAYSLAIDASGNVYVTGESYNVNQDYLTIKYNSSGDSVWVKRYNGIGNNVDKAYSIAVDNAGNVFVTGASTSGGFNYATLKYNSSGVQQWVQTYYGQSVGADVAYAVALDNSGGVYVTGYSELTGTYYDFATIKYNSSGVQQWLKRYDGAGHEQDIAFAMALDASGNVYIAGGSSGIGTLYDVTTIKYSQYYLNIHMLSSEVPGSFSLFQNYPNPFNPETKIRFAVPLNNESQPFVQIKVFDLLGSEVGILVDQQLKPGTYEVEWNASEYPSGIYFYRIETEAYIETKKMVLIK